MGTVLITSTFCTLCNGKLNCNTRAFQISCVTDKQGFFCFVAKYSYKILADIRKNLLEAKVCSRFVSSHGNMQWQLLLFILYTLIPVKFIFVEFSLRENIYVVSIPQNAFSCSSSPRSFLLS